MVGQPAAALGAAAADLKDALAGHLAQQQRSALPQPLGAPQEVAVAQKGAVLGVVVIRLLVPPGQPAVLLESSKSDSAFALDQPFSPPWTTGDFASQSA